ncbi:MAG: transcriptional repressor [Candidatus Eisenbacteria sp.]|nr:transcriptional repressor [Candidatus Eisenbacteria bacterium]
MIPASKRRMTLQRKIILEEIEKVNAHPAADEVYELVRGRLPKISLGTVYRNLEILSESGLIRKLDLGDGQWRFDGNLKDHYHVQCIRCGRIGDVFCKPCEDLEESVQEKTEFEILSHRLDFVGLCPECKRKEEQQWQD